MKGIIPELGRPAKIAIRVIHVREDEGCGNGESRMDLRDCQKSRKIKRGLSF
jgi:hypothetical protein